MEEQLNASDQLNASAAYRSRVDEELHLGGFYTVQCHDKDGNLKWEDTVKNLVTTVGANYALESALAASALTTVGPFMGLIGAVSYTTGPAISDTNSSHGGWTEAGGTNAPAYTGNRKTVVFSAAAAKSKASTGTYTFAITSAGTAKGLFLVLGTGALATKDNTAGTLYSAGLFTGGDKGTLDNGDSVTVTYTATA